MFSPLKITSPHDGRILAEIPYNTYETVSSEISDVYQSTKYPAHVLPAHERILILENLISLINRDFHQIVHTACQEGGKPIVDTETEVNRAIQSIKVAIASLYSMKGTEVPMGLTTTSINRLAFTTREPIGPVFAIGAFNHPFNLIVHQAIPAIAVGCPVIIKPALDTPLSCKKLIDLLYEAGLDTKYAKMIITSNEDTEKLLYRKEIKFLTFIGSAKVGWYLRSRLSGGTRCALEHGGAAPVIIEGDADLDNLIPMIVKGGFYHSGQVCVSVQRVYVQEDILDLFLDKLLSKIGTLKIGNPLDKKTEIGPLIRSSEVDRVDLWLHEAEKEGGKILIGGKRLNQFYYEPTVVLSPSINSKISQLEIFGPVLNIYPYKDIRTAISQANSLSYSFQASIFSKDIDKCFYAAKNLNASTVLINDHTAFRVDWMPFGGRDESGLGTGGIEYTMRDMTLEKMILIRSDKI